MKFHTTLRISANELTVGVADRITEQIRELGYPGDGWKRDDGDLVWECEFEGTTLTEIAERYNETRDEISTYLSGWNLATWTANPDDPIEVATRAARDVLAWEKHFDGIDLPPKLRESLEAVAGEEWKP